MRRTTLVALLAVCTSAMADGQLEVITLAEQREATPPAARDAPAELESIVVTGTRTEHRQSDSPVPVQVISARDIVRSGARDVAELLEREGAVHVGRAAGRGTTIEIQGLSSEHVLVLVDGRRLNGRINGAIDLSRLRLAGVERIEIVKGPSSALYGADALGGVVNIITRDEPEPASLRLRGGSQAQEAFTHAGLATRRWQLQGAGGYTRARGYDLDPARAGEDGADTAGLVLSASASRPLGRHGDLGLDFAWQLDDSQRLDSGSGGALYDTTKRIEAVRGAVAPRFAVAGGELRLEAWYQRYHDQFLQLQRGSDGNSTDEETLDQVAAAGLQFDRGFGDHRLIVGAEHQLERLEADRIAQRAERDRQALFAQDEFTLLDGRLSLVPGLRYDRDSQFGDQFSPKLALRLELAADWLLRASYGHGYRAPDFKQLLLRFENGAAGYRVDGNQDLQPESSRGANLALTWLPGPRTEMHLSAFGQRVRDLIDIVLVESGEVQRYSYANISSARLWGAELQAQWRPRPPLQLRLGYSYLHSRDEDTGEALSGRPAHRVHAGVYLQQARWALGLRGNWVGERRFTVDTANGPPTAAGTASAYSLFDLRGVWRGWPAAEFALGIKNLFDAGDPDYLPITPRSTYLEISRSF